VIFVTLYNFPTVFVCTESRHNFIHSLSFDGFHGYITSTINLGSSKNHVPSSVDHPCIVNTGKYWGVPPGRFMCMSIMDFPVNFYIKGQYSLTIICHFCLCFSTFPSFLFPRCTSFVCSLFCCLVHF